MKNLLPALLCAALILPACSSARLSTRSSGVSPKTYYAPTPPEGVKEKDWRKSLLRSLNVRQAGKYLYIEAVYKGNECFDMLMRTRDERAKNLAEWFGEVSLPDGTRVPGRFSAPEVHSAITGFTNDSAAPVYTLKSVFCAEHAFGVQNGFRLGIQPKHVAQFPSVELEWRAE